MTSVSGVRTKHMAASDQIVSQRLEVVDFAIEDDPYCLGFIGHRLRAAVQINNRKATMAQAYVAVDVRPLAVGAPMNYRPEHRFNFGAINSMRSVKDEFASDSTHRLRGFPSPDGYFDVHSSIGHHGENRVEGSRPQLQRNIAFHFRSEPVPWRTTWLSETASNGIISNIRTKDVATIAAR